MLTAAPGAGKTTRLPPELLKIFPKKIFVLEPRRIAAISAAQRIAEENGWKLGAEVGYQVRFDQRCTSDTRLIFLTEALLLRKLARDPELKDVSCVVLDEFHERSIHVDLALGALKELQSLARPDLKIVVMSATLDPAPLCAYLGEDTAADIPGKLFPLELFYSDKPMPVRTGPEFTEKLQRLVQKAMSEQKAGDLLCFLPGRGEIEHLRRALADWAEAKGIEVFPLHGQLDLQEQRAVLSKAPGGRRKIVLATNVAESSLTVDGVRIVVDSGLSRISQIHPRTGFASLDLQRISKASATQRAGRAARQAPGAVYRAWTTFDEVGMKDFEPAEIHRSDLAETLLLLSSLGLTNYQSFSWFEPPTEQGLERAQDFLLALGAIREKGELTELGRKLTEFPLHPRLAKFLWLGFEMGMPKLASELAALLSEPAGRGTERFYEGENDLWLRWLDWKSRPSHPKYRSLARAAEQLEQILATKRGKQASEGEVDEEKVAELLLAAFPDRLCRRRRAHEPQARMAGGRGVKLHPDSSVKTAEFFVALELSEGRDASEAMVFQAAEIPESLIEEKLGPLATPVKRLEWDDEKNRFFLNEGREWNSLLLGKEHRRPADPSEIEGKLAEVARARWDRLLAANEEFSTWLARLRFLKISLSEDQIQEGLELACYGERTLESVFAKSLVGYFEGFLAEKDREALARECPTHWVVPTGNRMKIEYSEEKGPSVEVRLQELFGLQQAPKIAGQALTLILLAPNYRPVQVTKDLPSFWKNAYTEVRKELRLRYPKHSWPEDPLTAAPQAKGRPRNV